MNTQHQSSFLLIGALLVFIVLTEAVAQYCIRRCKEEQKMHLFILGVFFYAFVCLGLYIMYDFRQMGSVNLLWSCMSIITIMIIGTVFFHEQLNIYDLIGMILVFTGLVLIFIKGH
uniref:Uncharacterized protein n=1 Tax=viral metagenome TaxID=1070528 RepID=A0A6C0CQH5_9ZZZZ